MDAVTQTEGEMSDSLFNGQQLVDNYLAGELMTRPQASIHDLLQKRRSPEVIPSGAEGWVLAGLGADPSSRYAMRYRDGRRAV